MFTMPGDASGRGELVGATYGTMGIASLFMPTIMGIIADRYIPAEKVLGFCHIVGAGLLFWASTITNVDKLYSVILINSCFYMPTIALNNSVSYHILKQQQFDVQKYFPPIRVWGTVGFIAAMWFVDIFGWTKSPNQFLIASFAGLLMGIYSLTMPTCNPSKSNKKSSIIHMLGLDAFVLFKQTRMVIFFFFAMLLGAALQISNAFGEPFLHDFEKMYQGKFAVEHPSLLMSLSQISETFFILTIPFFLKKFGIKKVMLMSLIAWVLRFGLLGIGNPGPGLIFLILSMIVYGMAFDFFNISGSLFVEKQAGENIRASAQGLFMFITNGLGAMIGGWGAGLVVDHFTNIQSGQNIGDKNWQAIWFTFAIYALVLAVVFAIFFRYKHEESKDV